MELLTEQQWTELFAHCTTSALHLELRDVYAIPDELEQIAQWHNGTLTDADNRAWWAPWLDMTRGMAARGVDMRRVRVVSEPMSDYIHYEWATALNHEGGEDSRWLPRHRATTIALPPVDYWLFDDRLVLYNHFSGAGMWVGNEITDNADTVSLCRAAFETAWGVATPHTEYKPVLTR